MDDAALPEKFGRFKVVAELGRGAMGVVYRAEDSTLGRTVAIKTVALAGTPEERDTREQRFMQEARAAGGISHPSIVTIYDVGREGDMAFIAMELLEGRDLRDLIQMGTLSASQAIAVATAVGEGLAYAHERRIVHRDIKPSNIMVLADGRVKLMDFGIARLSESTVKTQTGTLLGSPQYMSPDQISGRGHDHRSDIFSLGVVLYEMLTGMKPFGGEDMTTLLFSIVNTPARPPSQLNPRLPPVVDYIMARALKKRPEERYASAAEFAQDLRDCAVEVASSEAAVRASRNEGIWTGPRTTAEPPENGVAHTLPPHDEDLALRASTRFESVEALARLAVLPADAQQTRSREGWTSEVPRMRRKIDRPRVMVWMAYLIATAVAAVLIVV